jgi:hypothetical protein
MNVLSIVGKDDVVPFLLWQRKYVAGAGFRAAVLDLERSSFLMVGIPYVGNTLRNSVMSLAWTLFLELQI